MTAVWKCSNTLKHGFDRVALVHGDGQYAPECLPALTRFPANREADGVFGWRMMAGREARHRGLMGIRPTLFSYQLLMEVEPKPSLDYLLEHAHNVTEEKGRAVRT